MHISTSYQLTHWWVRRLLGSTSEVMVPLESIVGAMCLSLCSPLGQSVCVWPLIHGGIKVEQIKGI